MSKIVLSKIQKIHEMIKEGKGLGDKPCRYLLWYLSSVEEENQIRHKVMDRDTNHAHIYMTSANMVSSWRYDVDRGVRTLEEYEQWRELARKNAEPVTIPSAPKK